MYDTVILLDPIPCPTCGTPIDRVQANQFENDLSFLKIGDLVSSRPLSGVFTEVLFCEDCEEADRSDWVNNRVYLVVYNSILVGVYADLKVAQEKYESFDELSLLQSYIILYGRMRNWEERFWTQYSRLESYHDYLSLSAEERQAKRVGPPYMFGSILEILDMDIVDALTCLLKRVEGDKAESAKNKEEESEREYGKELAHLMKYYLKPPSIYSERAIQKLRNRAE